MPQVAAPEDVPALPGRTRMLGIEIRVPAQPVPGQEWPSRVWMRTREHLADKTMHACALTYISDMFTGLASVPGIDAGRPGNQHRPRRVVSPARDAGRLGADGPHP